VTVNVTPEMIAQFEAKRKADLAEQQRLDADYKAMVQAEKQRAEEFWAKKRSNLRTVTTKKEHQCDCGATIPVGTQVKVSTAKAVYGTNVGLKTVYHCNKCRPITEAS
jgi:hypothetical protein